MTPEALGGMLAGAGIATGIVLLIHALRTHTTTSGTAGRSVSPRRSRWSSVDRPRLAAAAAVAIVVAVLTRWPVAALAAAGIVWAWPRLFGAGSTARDDLDRIEALATWTESLRDTIAGSLGLEQAIPSSLDAASTRLQLPLAALNARLKARVPLPDALAAFADDLDDPSADLVVAALILNSRLRGPGLEATLTELAIHAREELELRQKVEAGRQSLRRSARIIAGVTLGFTAGLAVFARQYVEPYETPTGQIVLAAVVAVFAAGFWWLRKLAERSDPPRFLTTRTATLATGTLR